MIDNKRKGRLFYKIIKKYVALNFHCVIMNTSKGNKHFNLQIRNYPMMFNLFPTTKQVETYCPSCNMFYMDFVSNVNVTTYINNDKFYHATCYHCLNAMQDYEFYLAWQKLIFVNKTLSFNLSPINKFYN